MKEKRDRQTHREKEKHLKEYFDFILYEMIKMKIGNRSRRRQKYC